jgi:hypothetical protein
MTKLRTPTLKLEGPTYRSRDWTRPSIAYSMTTMMMNKDLKVGCLHPVACSRSGSGFPSNATLV